MDIFNKICCKIPSGYTITINLENGCGDININTRECNDVDWYVDDTPFYQQLEAALDWCIENEKSKFTPPRYDAVFRAGVDMLNRS